MKNYRNLLKKVYTEISEEIPESTRPYKLDEVLTMGPFGPMKKSNKDVADTLKKRTQDKAKAPNEEFSADIDENDLQNIFAKMDEAGGPPPGSVAPGSTLAPKRPTNQNIADMLSQLTPGDIAKIHRGNVAASHPGATDELINKLTSEGVGGGPATRLGALADNEKAFNEMLQNKSYRELFGGDDLANYSTKEKQALLGRHEEMLMDELTHPNAPYKDRANPRVAKRQREIAHEKLMRGEGYSQGYNEAAHMNTNTTVASEAMSGGTRYSGYYQPSAAPINGGAFGAVEGGGGMGMAASMGLGALVGGTANYATGGSFGEGAMMGGLAGGAIKIGSRAIAANEAGIENYLQRTALGSEMTAGMTRVDAANRIASMETAAAGAGFMQNRAFNILKSDSASMGMQTRYMVMGGSALSGVSFTGRRNDKRRGFNSHRGNRI